MNEEMQPTQQSSGGLFSRIAKLIASSFIHFAIIVLLCMGLFAWKFSPLLTVHDDGVVELFNGTIVLATHGNSPHQATPTPSVTAQRQHKPSSTAELTTKNVVKIIDNPTDNAQFGDDTINNAVMDNHNSFGYLKISDSIINNELNVFGALDATNITVHKMSVFGGVEISDSTIKGDLNVFGGLEMENCHLNSINISGVLDAKKSFIDNTITASSELLSFANSNVADITVKQLDNHSEPQLIKLLRNTVVNGDIHFESGNGIVELDATSKINGKVYGGTVKQ